MINIDPKIAELLKSSKDLTINDPIEINNEWFLIQREKCLPAAYNEYYENKICMELLERELEIEYKEEYLNLINKNLDL